MKLWVSSGLSSTEKSKGFTLTELLIVVVVIAIMAAIIVFSIEGVRQNSYTSSASASLNSIAKSMQTYKRMNGSLPPDTSVGIPAEIVKIMNGQSQVLVNTTGTWPNSYYDYEVWDLNNDGVDETYQVSIRFCRDSNGNPVGENGVKCEYPGTSWAKDFIPISSVFYCLQGYCRAHGFAGDVNTPAYCFNCADNKSIPLPN